MTEDDFDGAQSQPLRPLGVYAGIPIIADARVPPGETHLIQEGSVLAKITGIDSGAVISPAELLAWRAYMRANPPTPEPTKKPHYRPESVWEKPQEWMRRDGAEQ